jgi:hypothetical protein
MDAELPEPSRLTSHQPPALLIAAVDAVDAAQGRVRVLPHQGLDAWQLLEACAQAVAVLAGARRAQASARAAAAGAAAAGPPAAGRLVAVRDFVVARPARADEAVAVEARAGARLGALAQHAVRALAGHEVLASGELTIAEQTSAELTGSEPDAAAPGGTEPAR